MTTESTETERVVRLHVPAVVEQKGVAAIVEDYHDAARFSSETEIYHLEDRR
ncbi:MAG: hypothetical protein ACR2LI_04960 [Propionibacteriaceae bacterium]